MQDAGFMNYYHGSSLWSFSKGGMDWWRRLPGLLVVASPPTLRFGNRALRALRGSFRTYIGTKIYIHNMYWYFDIVAMFSKCFLVIEFCIVSVHQICTKIHIFFIDTLVRNVQYSRKFVCLLPSRSRNVQLGERKWIILISIVKGMILAEVYSHFGFQDSFIFYAWWM